MGIGMALTEETIADRRGARIVNPSLAEYYVPVHADVPEIEVIFVGMRNPHVGAMGAKAVGEIGIVVGASCS